MLNIVEIFCFSNTTVSICKLSEPSRLGLTLSIGMCWFRLFEPPLQCCKYKCLILAKEIFTRNVSPIMGIAPGNPMVTMVISEICFQPVFSWSVRIRHQQNSNSNRPIVCVRFAICTNPVGQQSLWFPILHARNLVRMSSCHFLKLNWMRDLSNLFTVRGYFSAVLPKFRFPSRLEIGSFPKVPLTKSCRHGFGQFSSYLILVILYHDGL